MNLNELTEIIHANAKAHGWWDEERSFGEIIALCHSELSEALEEYRDGRPDIWFTCNEDADNQPCNPSDGDECENFCERQSCQYRDQKPEGIAIELADCIIRILDYCGHAGIDIEQAILLKHKYNKTRPYKHGGKVI